LFDIMFFSDSACISEASTEFIIVGF
jgi:hypothetical protein